MPYSGLFSTTAGPSTGLQYHRHQTATAGTANAREAVLRALSGRPREPRKSQGKPGAFRQWRFLLGLLAALAWVCAASGVAAQTVMLSTSMGDIVIQLDAQKAPKSVQNFLQYVKAGHYNGTVFHRVIPDFMVQGGGMKPDLSQKPTRPPIALESKNGLDNNRGTVAMARTSIPDSATSQFFINLKNNDFLNSANSRDGNGYAVFGRVLSGMDIVDKIAGVATQSTGGQQNVPVQPVTILEAVVQQ